MIQYDNFYIFINCFRKENEESLVGLDKKIADAVEIGGDVEVLDALFAKARFYSKTGAWTAAVTVYDEILAKPKSSTGKKIDSIMEKARIAFFDLVSALFIWFYVD